MKNLKLEKSVVSVIKNEIAEEKIFGAAVRIEQNGETLLNENIGVKKDALFRLASMTKPITAAAVLLETERGRLRLDTPVKKFLPAYADMYIGKKENGCAVPYRKIQNDITILHLMTHTSGLLSGDFAEQVFTETDSFRTTLEKAVDYYPTTLLAFEPFSEQSYSALAAFDVAARIIEMISGMPYDRYLKENIFEPLGMTDTGFSLEPGRRARLTPVHARDASGHAYAVEFSGAMGSLPDTYFSAGGGLVGTIDDYTKFADMLRRDGVGLLKRESVALMRTVHWPGWGIGVRVVKGDKHLPDGCYGWSGAYGTHFWIDPSRNLYAIYMKNSVYDGGAGAKSARSFEKAVSEGLS